MKKIVAGIWLIILYFAMGCLAYSYATEIYVFTMFMGILVGALVIIGIAFLLPIGMTIWAYKTLKETP